MRIVLASLYNKVTTTDHFWVSFQFIHSRVIWDPWEESMWISFLFASYNLFGSLFCKESTKWTSAHLLFGACIYHLHMFTCRQLHYSHILFSQAFQCWNDFPNCNEKPSCYCNVFSPNSSWLALTNQVFENRVNFDFTKFKIGWIQWYFGELNIHTHHSPNWMQFSVRETTQFLSPWDQWSTPMSNVSQCRSGRFLSLCVWQQDPDFKEHPPLDLSFLQKPKIANGFESGS
jgi:hypothetical protein